MFKKSFLVLAIFSLFFLSACSLKKEKELSLEEAKVKAQQFVNDNFMDPSAPIEISSIVSDPQTGLYKFSIDLGGGELVDSYISKDGKMFFPQAYDIAELEATLGGDETSTSTIEENSSSDTQEEISLEESTDFDTDKELAIYFFWGDGCGYCASQKTAMSQWAEKFPNAEIKAYEVWNNDANRQILEKMATAYGTTFQGVPMTFIGDKYWVGFADSLGAEMETKIDECLKGSCENPGQRIQ
ncbi:MAG: hypothetical protein WC928_01865 [Patescibacteria group bacterium]|jgi:thiol-disulfide isomerase/thioredoxin